ncbi:MAG TPA: transglycosylase SLT domain-containing protein [Patescibacteria group bacterium]|nr:transglycosylase SLT domain-containing protein [Patescibacteria group bacterium]
MLGRYRDSVRAWSDPFGRVLFRLRLRPNHLTVAGLAASLVAAGCFIAGQTRTAGLVLIVAGLLDLLDGSLARASGQATAFGAFLDSVIDRYSDIAVMLGIVVLYARTPNPRGALVAMAGLAGSVMVSYTKARAESIGVECNVGMMERPERLICLIFGALLDIMEPALWVLAVLANLTAVQRIVFTRRMMRAEPRRARVLLPALAAALLLLPAEGRASTEIERAWARAVEAYQQGDATPLAHAFATEAAQTSPIGDHVRWLLADALARGGDLAGARAAALGVADHHPDSRLAPRALVLASVLASRAGDEAAAQAALRRLLERYPDAIEVPEALYLLGQTAEARGHRDVAALAYRQLRVLAPTTGYEEAATDRLDVLVSAGTPLPPLSLAERIDRAERLLRGGVPKTAGDEAERIAGEARDAGIVVRALRVVGDAAARLGRYEAGAKALEAAAKRAPSDQQPRLRIDQARLLIRAGQDKRAIPLLASVAATAAESDAAEAMALQARVLDEGSRDAEAVALYRQIVKRFPNRGVAAGARWRLGWIAWLHGDLRAAAGEWKHVADVSGGRDLRVQALYWCGRALEAAKDEAGAGSLYTTVLAEAPRSYYGMLAAQRVGGAAPAAMPREISTPAPALPADPSEALKADPRFARVDLLRRIGLVEYAWEELEDVVQSSVGDPVRLYGASSAYVRDERYHLALRIVRRHFGALSVSADPALPRAFWEVIYPFGWRAEVSEAAKRAGLDPFLVAAVVREESSYYPRAVSRAGARGLMQLMPATAKPMADVRGLPFEGGGLLDDPRANLEMGTAFLAGLMKEFGDPRLAIAAYNAGPKRVHDWWKARRTGDMEAFVEQIPYDETRKYVKHVMLAWSEYRRLYGGEPK